MAEPLHLRVATEHDVADLHRLIAVSVRGLMTREYSPSQLEAALGNWLGVDTTLVKDGTYFVVEAGDPLVMVGCGGWSKRKTLYGADHRTGREDSLLDPRTERAKIRAFFVHPDWARKGIGTIILNACEKAATAAGFTQFEMGATLTGVPLYKRLGYEERENIDLPLPNGEVLPIVRMTKSLPSEP
jgi:GNAT superfamily N-acetyltransferase